MKYQECFMLRTNLSHLPLAGFDGTKYVGSLAIFVPLNQDSGLRLGGSYAQFGDIMMIRSWEADWNKNNKGTFRVGPVGSIDPKDFRDTVKVDYLFIIPKEKEAMVEEYNRLADAAEELDNRLAWLDATGKDEFSESEFRLDEVMQQLDVEVSDEKAINMRKILKTSIKI